MAKLATATCSSLMKRVAREHRMVPYRIVQAQADEPKKSRFVIELLGLRVLGLVLLRMGLTKLVER